MTFPLQSILRGSYKTPNSRAVVYGDNSTSYQELARYVIQFGKAFEVIGVRPGMLIGLGTNQLDKITELVLMCSLQALGAVRVCDYSDREVRLVCDLILSFDHDPSADEVGQIYLNQEWIQGIKNTPVASSDYERFTAYCPAPEHAILFGNTSGTTGKKKYFLERYSAVSAQVELILNQYFDGDTRNCISPYGVNISATYVAACATFFRGGTLIFSPREDFLRLARAYPHSHALMLLREASYFANMISEKLKADEKLASIRVLGAHLPDRIREYLIEHLSKKVMNSYSSNEVGQIAEILPNGEGRIYPGVQLKIVAEDGQDLPNGALGRIATKSAQQITSYLWNPQLNVLHFKGDWFISHDLAYIAASGNLVYVDRADHMINLGGIKIPPQPLEERIKQLSFVNDCVLLGENSFFEVETLLVVVELNGSADLQKFNGVIESMLQGSFTAYRIFYMRSFPRTETGKIKRSELHPLLLKASQKLNSSLV